MSLITIISPKIKEFENNFVVKRSLPHVDKRTVGPFIFWDFMGPVSLNPDNEMIVPAHPHIGLATITYLFSGEILHRDSLGNEQIIRTGEVNWMTAGKGIAHSERSLSPKEGQTLEGIQLWVGLPKESEEVDPSFVHIKKEDLPTLESYNHKLILIAGEYQTHRSPVPVYSNLFYLHGKIKKGEEFIFDLNNNQEGALYLVNGEIEAEQKVVKPYEMACFKNKIQCTSKMDSEFVILGGSPLEGKRHMWWNFVSSDPDRIERAKKDWKEGKFEKVINEDLITPLPT